MLSRRYALPDPRARGDKGPSPLGPVTVVVMLLVVIAGFVAFQFLG
ncbi:hypothetical protein ACFQFC_09840 [Amorphoplanes digitatis]|uniref:Uncharacterized protein n=1 Tax=Actinoplanes digitatis TaxID=1868 RepID=A0A7W7MRP7_9ACTN|nr:hypothetical protein [Actinoplanes digitatis]MBB4764498.1 hypothetical protein [Actinoplanes digitatis]